MCRSTRGDGKFKADLPRALANELNNLTPSARRLLSDLFDDLARLEQGIAEVTREIETLAASDDRVRRLMTIHGIGPIAATAFVAAVGSGRQFRCAGDMAA